MAGIPSTGLPAPVTPEPVEPVRTLDQLHADFVAEHVQVAPDPLPEGAADQVEAVVEHLHAVVEVLEVIEPVEAEGRPATDAEIQRLEEPQAVLAASEFDPVD